MSLNSGSQKKGSTITIVPKIDVPYPTLAPDPKVKVKPDCSIDYGMSDIEDAGLLINQTGYRTKKAWQGDHNPIVPAEVAGMPIATPPKMSEITTDVINDTYVRYYAGYQTQSERKDYAQRSLTMGRENVHNIEVDNGFAAGATLNYGYAGYIKNNQYLADYSLNGYGTN